MNTLLMTHISCSAQCFMRALYYVMVKSVTLGAKEGLGTLWAPVWYRNLITNFLLHIGGLHSGCGFATVMWLVYNLVLMITKHQLYSLAILIVGIILLAIVTIACVTAFPYLRFFMHNHFEHGCARLSPFEFFGFFGLSFFCVRYAVGLPPAHVSSLTSATNLDPLWGVCLCGG